MPHKSIIPGKGPRPEGYNSLDPENAWLKTLLGITQKRGWGGGLRGYWNIPGGTKRMPSSSSSCTLILFTPGATYHLSAATEARGGFCLKPSERWPWNTEMSTSCGVTTSVLIKLRKTAKVCVGGGGKYYLRAQLVLHLQACSKIVEVRLSQRSILAISLLKAHSDENNRQEQRMGRVQPLRGREREGASAKGLCVRACLCMSQDQICTKISEIRRWFVKWSQ